VRYLLAWLLRARSSGRVYDGPFRGMLLPDSRYAFRRLHLLMGTFEMELRAVMEGLVAVGFRTIINLGAAGGYYAVGLALRCPGARVLAFETLPEQRQQMAVTSKANGVDDRVVAHGTCTAHSLGECLAAAEPPVLVLADIEGNELSLFDAEVAARLVRATVVIETHDDRNPGTTQELRRRFAATHRVEAYAPRTRTRADVPAQLSSGPWRVLSWLLWRLVRERRPAAQQWLLFTPLSSA
jgi:predicted O-methyltransferase YrrM